MRDIRHDPGFDALRDGADTFEVDGPRVGRSTANNQLGLMLFGQLLQGFVVQGFVFATNPGAIQLYERTGFVTTVDTGGGMQMVRKL